MPESEERPYKFRKLDPPESEGSKMTDQNPPSLEAKVQKPPGITDVRHEDEVEHFRNSEGQNEEKPKMSKSQLKKLKKAEQWEAGKDLRRLKRREKHREKQARKAEQRAELQTKIANGGIAAPPSKQEDEKKKKNRPRRPIQTPVALILDCDFNELMTEKELISLGAQLTRCYSENRSTPYRSHLVISSWGGPLKSRFETVLSSNHLSWKGVRFFEEDFVVAAKTLNEIMRGPDGGRLIGAFAKEGSGEQAATAVAPPANGPSLKENNAAEPMLDSPLPPAESSLVIPTAEAATEEQAYLVPITEPEVNQDLETPALVSEPSVVYLTADSPHTISSLSPNTSYIIGGIVDKNRHKGICYKRACERGIPTAKLPIGEYMTMQSRSVLAVNHVVEIMLKWLETGDWGEAFLSVIPKRKEAKLKVKKGEEQDGDGSQSEDEDIGEILTVNEPMTRTDLVPLLDLKGSGMD